MDDQNIIEFYQRKKFPHILFGLLVAIGLIIFMGIIQTALFAMATDQNESVMKPLALIISQVICIIIPVFIIARISPLGRTDLLRLNFKVKSSAVAAALVGLISLQFFFMGFISIQEASIPEMLRPAYKILEDEYNKVYLSLFSGKNGIAIMMSLLAGAVFPAVAEELLFRGLCQRSIEERMKPTVAILITGAIFGTIHFNFINMIPLVIIGIYLGYLAYLSKSIILPMLVHFANNAFSIWLIINPTGADFEKSTETLPIGIATAYTISGLLAAGASLIAMKKIYSNKKSLDS